VRAYTDGVAQALLKAEKIAIIKLHRLRCTVPYALEGMLRRELDSAGAQLHAVVHGEFVLFDFSLPVDQAPMLRSRLGEAAHGRLAWLDELGAGIPHGPLEG
jgi:putative IMPACT (imprinted ancient) family translation regulator